MDLFLVRHGLTDWNEAGRLMGRSEIALNARGRAQAQAVAAALSALRIRSVLASPQRRAQETAQVLAEPHGLAVQTTDALAEVWVGRWQGKVWEELEGDPDVQRCLADPTYVCDALEAGVRVQERMVALVERLRTEGDETVVLVSHGDPIRMLIVHYLSIELASYRRLEVVPGSVSVLRFNRFGSRLVLLNWRPGTELSQLTS